MTDPVIPLNGPNSQIYSAGVPTVAIFGGVVGGFITNPVSAADQNIAAAEVLYYDMTGPASAFETGTTFPLQPGQTLLLPAGLATDVSVNAVTAGHRFSAVMWQAPTPFPPTPVPATFPPNRPTSLLKTIPSYLYEEYQDDDDLQAWVRAYNNYTQEFIDWFNQTTLPVYTNTLISGTLLDWVALGLYGMKRPSLSSGTNKNIGPYNTGMLNQLEFNRIIRIGAGNVTVTTDDIFKRIMTWNLYRGDGKTFTLKWLKRRIVRFLTGPNGTAPNIDNTYSVSASYASAFEIDIVLPADPNATILKEAIDSGAVLLPFQISFSVTIS